VDALEKADHKSSAPSRVPSVESVAVEKRNAEKALVEPECESYEAQRRESQLVQRFKGFLEQQGHIVERLRITPVGEAKSIFTDVYVKNLNLLIEAKGTSDRIAIRMAIGQLMDYKRFVKPKTHCAVLVPMLPRNDLLKLLKYAGIAIYYPTAGGFTAHNNN
jgi:hypothetical protein